MDLSKIKSLIQSVGTNLWEISAQGNMRVPARIYVKETMLDSLFKDNALLQAVNVASLPGIVRYSLSMPDIHSGYGFPIGGVAAIDPENGVISPGGVGYDINCGVRFIKTNLKATSIKDKIPKLVNAIQNNVPSGVGSSGAIRKLTSKELATITVKGVNWAIENGFGNQDDLEMIEESGQMPGANPECISFEAVKRGLDQIGTLGSGNHFIEVGTVADIYDNKTAEHLGIFPGQLIVMIHSGSRGLGHQVCTDYINKMNKNYQVKNYVLPDKQLICAPINSQTGRDYYGAMAGAANYAWTNRQIMMSLTEKSFLKTLSISSTELGFKLVYDISHNIAKFEFHKSEGKEKRLCVHRKGATRAFPPYHQDIPKCYQKIGQPVIIPGDMGRSSFLCTGTEKAMLETFGSSCHGAGRVLSRSQALRTFRLEDVKKDYQKKGIYFSAASKKTLIEEFSMVYKDVSDVVNTLTESNILNKVCRTTPLGVIKG